MSVSGLSIDAGLYVELDDSAWPRILSALSLVNCRNSSSAILIAPRRFINSKLHPTASFNMTFPQFTSLPPELQNEVWETSIEGPSMHIFDVCSPSWRDPKRSAKAFQDEKRFDRYKNNVFLDALDTSDEELNRTTRVAGHAFDPSMYKQTDALLSTSRVTAGTTRALKFRGDTNTVYLPGRNRKITLPASDVIMLRFRDVGAAMETAAHCLFTAEGTSSSDVLKSRWSAEMLETMRAARRIALDVSEVSVQWMQSHAALQEISYLASMLHHGLEVLYLVDHCVGRCKGCKKGMMLAQDVKKQDKLWRRLHRADKEDKREGEGDVIHGVTKRYVEVCGLEGLKWTDQHPAYVFAERFDRAVRNYQHGPNKGKFQGVRVLVMEDEKVEGLEAEVRVDCTKQPVAGSPLDRLNKENMQAFSTFLASDALGVGAVEGRVFRMALGWDPKV